MKYLLLFLLSTTVLRAQGADSLNMTLIGQLNPITGTGPHASLWGYTAPDGREYALFASQTGTHVIDITESPIRQVDFVAGPVDQWREMKTYGEYAYVVTESMGEGSGIQIIDLSTLPDSVSLVRVDNSVVTNVHTIQIEGHYMYAMGTVYGGAVVMDLEPDPLFPRAVGLVSTRYFHDAFIRNDTLLGAAIYGGGCEIWDISDRGAPREIGGTTKTMKVWDITDLDHITKVAEFTPDPADIVHNVYSSGRYAYVSWYTAGVRVIDMIDPTNPREVGFYDTYAGTSGGFDGAWEVYARFPSGKIIVSDRQSGLWVLRFNGATAASLSGVVRDSLTGRPIAGAGVRIESSPVQRTDSSGRYRGGGSQGGTLRVAASAFGYIPKIMSVQLDGDISRDIHLVPAPLESVRIIAEDTLGAPIDSFSWSIEPHIKSRVAGQEAVVTLPADSTYTAYVGKWGYIPRQMLFTVSAGREVKAILRKRYQDDARLDLGWQYGSSAEAYSFGRVWISPDNVADPIAPRLQATGTAGEAFSTIPAAAPGSERELQNPSRIVGIDVALTTPPMDLRDFPAPLIVFDIWIARGNPAAPGDPLRVEISGDDGESWRAVPANVERNRWGRIRIPIREYLPVTSQMRMRVTAVGSNGAEPLVMIDNFFLTPNGAAGVESDRERSSGLSPEIFPNPVRGAERIEVHAPAGADIVRTELYDLSGKLLAILEPVAPYRRDSPALHLLPKEIAAGWYVIRLVGRDGTSRGVVVVVE